MKLLMAAIGFVVGALICMAVGFMACTLWGINKPDDKDEQKKE